MKYLITFLALFFCTSLAWGQNFIPGTEDIPLMENLAMDENETISFDTPAGQIMQVQAKTNLSPKAVQTFYENTLPAIGWQKNGPNSYHRGQDKMTLSTKTTGTTTIVKFQMTIPNN